MRNHERGFGCSWTSRARLALGRLFTVCMCATGLLSRPAHAQQALTHLAEVQGQVFTSRIVGQTLYLGGDIFAAGRRVPYAAPLAVSDGRPAPHAPRFAGAGAPQVTSIIPDGNGGWFVAGTFETIDGQPHVNLAHLDAALHVTSWSPPAPDGVVNAMATDGSTLWLGGAFTHMGGTPRGRGAAVSVATGQLLGWDAQADNEVLALALAGASVYAGGRFTNIAGGSHPQLALLHATTAVAQAFDAQASTPGGAVYALALDGTVLYAGGAFADMGGAARANAAAFSTATGALVGAWRPDPDGPVLALQTSAAGVFIAGAFGTVGNRTRTGIVQANKTNGNLTSWNPDADGGVTTMTLANGVLYLAGGFQNLGGQPRSMLGAVDALTGLATAWRPASSSQVVTLAAGTGHVYAGGQFTDLGGLMPRGNLVAIDLVSGDVLPWGPTADDPVILSAAVRSMDVVGSTLYVGGDFTQVNGTPRVGLAAIDLASASLLAWNPAPDGAVRSMVRLGSLMYVGGFFNTVAGTPRAHLAAVDLVSGALASWDPGANSAVWALATDGTRVFAGGSFATVGGLARSAAASVDPNSGAVLPWTPSIHGMFKFGGQFVPPIVYALAVQGNDVFLGGSFGTGNGHLCSTVMDASSAVEGAFSAPAPFFEAGITRVNALHSRGGTVVVGGERVELRSYLLPSGTVTAWTPTTNFEAVASISGGENLFVVGWLNGGFTAFVDPAALETPTPRASQHLQLSPSAPNPLRAGGRIAFALPRASVVDLAIFDAGGRLVRTLIGGEPMAAGSHQVPLARGALPPGLYLARLRAAGEMRVSRIVVAP